jgi:hypothetical protein
MTGDLDPMSASRSWRGGTAGRLVLTVAIVYALHFTTNVVRETYLAVAIAERGTIRVDPFLGLHPDLFEIPGRGVYANNNPGASMLAAVPYAVVRPALEVLYWLEPSLVAPKPPVAYDDPRPNRTRFMNEMRARGLDIRLGLAAIAIQLLFNVPLGAGAALAMFLFLRARLRDESAALWMALLFAFGTPIFFRSAFLNQNLVLAYCTLGAYLTLVWREDAEDGPPGRARRQLLVAGALLGTGVVCDYSALPLLLVFGLWAVARSMRGGRKASVVWTAGLFAVGALGPICVLLAYQYAAFGNPFLPAQAYMPSTELSAAGWHGLHFPIPDLLWRNLVDPGYGVFAFCPMLVAAFFAPRYLGVRSAATRDELVLLFSASAALYLFSSSISYAALQWNTGIRYLVPAVPLLFIALVGVLMNASRVLAAPLVVSTVGISWCVSMARETVPVSVRQVLTGGLALPWVTVLEKTEAAYLPLLPRRGLPLAVYLSLAVVLWLIWRRPAHAARARLP